jgi:hypothetical protein
MRTHIIKHLQKGRYNTAIATRDPLDGDTGLTLTIMLCPTDLKDRYAFPQSRNAEITFGGQCTRMLCPEGFGVTH